MRILTDLGAIAALAMLVIWGVGTFVIGDAPGWLHGLLTLGVFVLIWRIVVRGTPAPRAADRVPPKPGAPRTR